ncbi:uncharacterized protein Fot_28369 [Forsythia ovata]|uniref:Uncharacterized protein n=1 Tax=Forsythia ovata TaxID=205694 RepID=A0ABD1SQL8_9LAMI
MEDSEKIDLEAEALSLIDLSSQNDNQFSGNQTEPKSCELSGVLGAEKEANSTLGIDVDDHIPELRESTDPGKTQRNGRCNLRKSLAWDSAFFSNAGVLDPEELSTMIEGAEKDKNHLLPGIEEDVESISTLESDNFTMDSLEDDLFVDIRASIQRSSKKVPNAKNCTSKSASMEIDNKAISTLKKEGLASQNKLHSEPALKNTSRQTIRMPKCQPKQNAGTQGSGKAVKQDSGHSQSVTKIDGSISLRPKPPKAAISRATFTSTLAAKRDSTGSSRVKSEIGSSKLSTVTVSSKGSQAPKVPVLSGARRVLPKPAPSSKSSSFGSSTSSKVPSTRSSTSSDSSDSTLSKTTAKSPLMTARRTSVKSGNIRPASSGSIPKTLSKAAVKTKLLPSTLSAHQRSTKISSSVSPASSIGEWSSASSSSSSTVYQRSSNSRNSLDISSRQSVDYSVVPLGLRNHSPDRIADGHVSKVTALPGNNSNKSSTQSGTLQAPAKPSGLRMPSPKIGYFDGGKSLVRTPNGTPRTQSGLGNVLTKSGASIYSPKGSSNIKPKIGKVSTARAASSLANVKADSPNVRSPASFPGRSCASNDSRSLTDVKYSPILSPEAQGNRSGENCLKSQEVHAKGPDENKQVLEAGTGAYVNENLGDLIDEAAINMHRNIVTGEIKIARVEDNNALGSKSMSQRVDKDVLDDQNHLNCLRSICKTNEDQQESSGPKKDVNPNVYCQKDEPLADLSDSASVSFPATASTTTASRAPFALKDSFYNSECLEFSKESAVQLVEKIAIPLPTSEQKENS